MGKSVWWVESGEYSDYRVNGVFSSEKNADKYAAQFGGDVVEVEMDRSIDLIQRGYKPYQILMNYAGNSAVQNAGDIEDTPVNIKLSLPYVGDTGILWASYLYGSGWFESKEHAVKVFNEHRLRMIAENEWQPDPEGVQQVGALKGSE